MQPPTTDDLIQQPAVRLDYQMSPKLRFTGKYSGDRRRKLVTPGLISGFTDVLNPYPYITNYAATVNYTMNPTTFIEATYGFIRNELVGGNENGILVNDSANRLNGLADFPLLYKDAGVVDPRYYVMEVMQDVKPGFWDGTRINLPPTFSWGGRIGAAPPNQRYPGWLNINRTQDVAVSVTKVAGRHTMKAGFYNNHSFKAQNAGFGALFQGDVNFGNDTNNALDSGFGYANAALGVFTRYQQASQLIEGNMIYNNREFYAQDNWKVNSRLTMDYGLRFTHQQPQHDKFGQMSNFFPDEWSAAQAPVFYVAGCSNGAATCSGNIRNAMDPRNGQILTAPGAANTQAAIGTPIPGSGNPLNGIRKAGDGIADTGYVWPTIVVAPRFGLAYDLTGNQSTIFRAGGGLYFDRPDGNTIFGIPGNPPIATTQDLRNGQLQTVGQGLSTVAVPALTIFQYDAQVSGSWQWNAGVQRTLPWAMVADFSYVGNRGTNRIASYNLNSVDIGAAFLAKNQDPTLAGSSSVPGATAYSENILKPYRGLGNINQNTTDFWDEYHSLQMSLNRRFRNGFSAGVNYTYGISFKGNTGLVKRFDHAPDGTATLRADQADYEELLGTLDRRPHIIKANGVWSSAARARELRACRRVHPERLADCRRAHGRFRYDLRSELHLPEQRGQREPDRLAELRREDRLRRRSGQRLFRQPVRAVQRRLGHRPAARQRRSRVRAQHPARLPRQAGRSVALARHSPRWRSPHGVPGGRVQRVQRGHHQRPQQHGDVREPWKPRDREQSVQRRRLAQHGALEAEQLRLWRCDRRPGDAQRPGAAPLPVLSGRGSVDRRAGGVPLPALF